MKTVIAMLLALVFCSPAIAAPARHGSSSRHSRTHHSRKSKAPGAKGGHYKNKKTHNHHRNRH